VTSRRAVTIVGAGPAGVGLVSNLRRRGLEGVITLIGEEAADPYDRPPLSKAFLTGAQTADNLRLARWKELMDLGVNTIPGRSAQSLDLARRAVTLDTGEVLESDEIVVATGVKARTLAGFDHMDGCMTLRTLEDARRLRSRLRPGGRVVILGAGFIGLEAASAMTELQCTATIVEPRATALADRLPGAVSAWLTSTHCERGARFHFGASVTDIRAHDEGAMTVQLTTGEVLDADVVLVGIGTIPQTAWLESSGLVLENGVRCDAYSRAAEGVYAIGDVSSPFHPALGRHLRVEHRSNASEQALALAETLTGEPREHSPLPFFWTDQFEYKIQMFGVASPDAEFRVIDGAVADRYFIGAYEGAAGIEAVLTCNAPPKQLMPYRRELTRRYSTPSSLASTAAR
jgi:3-phenylpropionate/trans-cinnamate dioxygenase ferredoxin reductase component